MEEGGGIAKYSPKSNKALISQENVKIYKTSQEKSSKPTLNEILISQNSNSNLTKNWDPARSYKFEGDKQQKTKSH